MDILDDNLDEGQEEDWSLPVESDHSTSVNQNQRLSIEKTSNKQFDKSVDTWQSDSIYVSKLGHSRTIIHIDIDCFYAQVEMLRNPELKFKPLGIQQKYLLVTCNYVAREFGVTKLMGIKDAKEKCPDLVIVNGEDLTHYREMSYKISEFLQKYTANVERLGFDENYLDVSEMVNQRLQNGDFPEEIKGYTYSKQKEGEIDLSQCSCGCHTRLLIGSQIASDIREALHEELGITCCAGISYNKLLAKLVAGQHKPNQQTTLLPEQTENFMSNLSKARDIPGVGWTTAKKLSSLGVSTIQNLQEVPVSDLVDEIGETVAVHIKQLSYGVDDSPVIPFKRPQTLSDEDSFKKCSTVCDVRLKIRQLLTSLMMRLKDDGRIPHTVRLAVRRASNRHYSRESRQCPLPSHVMLKATDNMEQSAAKIEEIVMSLFYKLVDVNQPFHLKLINIAFCNLHDKARNSISSFFSPKKLKDSDCEHQTATDVNTQTEIESNKKDLITYAEKLEKASPVSGLQKWLAKSKSTISSSTESGSCAESELKLTVKDSSDTVKCFTEVNKSMENNMYIQGQGVKRRNKSGNTHTENVVKKKKLFTENLKSSPGECAIAEINDISIQMVNLPHGIDMDVFLQLPLSVQKEIMNDIKSSTGFSRPSVSVKNDLNSVSQSSETDTKLDPEDNIRISTNVPCVRQTTECKENETLAAAKQSSDAQPFDKGDNPHSSSLNSDTLNSELCINQNKMCITESHEVEDTDIPPDIDHDVFITLPSDIKKEIMEQWKNDKRNQHVERVQSKTNSKQKHVTQKNPSILSYFGKTRKS